MNFLKALYCAILFVQLFSVQSLVASVDFATPDSKIVFKSEGSSFKISDASSVQGLTKQAIVSDFSVDFRTVPGFSQTQTNSHAIIDVPYYYKTRGTPGVDLDICNSNAIIALAPLVKDNSNAIIHRIVIGSQLSKQNSDVICLRSVIGSDLSQDSSNVICERVIIGSELAQKNSNVICDKSVTGSELAKENSNVIVQLEVLVFFLTQDAEDLGQKAINDSNAIVFGLNNNSNAILKKCDEIRENSNAIVSLAPQIQVIEDNSNAIISLRADLSTIDALVPNVLIDTGINVLDFSLFLSRQNLLTVEENGSTSPQTEIDGQGHFIHFARNTSHIVRVGDNVRLLFKNIVLKDFSDNSIQLGNNSEVVFGDGTVIELAENEMMTYDWIMQGSSELNGMGNQLKIGANSLKINQESIVTLKDIILTDVRDTNIRVIGDYGEIIFEDAQICLSRNFQFTTGSFLINRDVVITGSKEFSYQTSKTSTIATKSTLMIGSESSFCYEPIVDDKNLVYLEDETSILFLDGSTLKLTTTGLRLLRGRFVVDRVVNVHSIPPAQVALSEFLTFGNGILNDDVTIEVLPSGLLDISDGIGVLYENVQA